MKQINKLHALVSADNRDRSSYNRLGEAACTKLQIVCVSTVFSYFLNVSVAVTVVFKYIKKRGSPSALKLPHTQGLGRGPTILVYCTQLYPVFYTSL